MLRKLVFDIDGKFNHKAYGRIIEEDAAVYILYHGRLQERLAHSVEVEITDVIKGKNKAVGSPFFFHMINRHFGRGFRCLFAGYLIAFRILNLYGSFIGEGLGRYRRVGRIGRGRDIGVISAGRVCKWKYPHDYDQTQAGGGKRAETGNPFFCGIFLTSVHSGPDGVGKAVGQGNVVVVFFSFIHNSSSFLGCCQTETASFNLPMVR